MEEDTRVTVRLPSGLVKQLEEMVACGKYANMSEAIEDCVREYLKSNPVATVGSDEKKETIKMESLVLDEISMDELIRDATKKYVRDHMH